MAGDAVTGAQPRGNDRAARLREIVAILDVEGTAAAGTLARRLGVSGATIRRDLAELEACSLVTRRHGRVERTPTAEVPVELRDGQFGEAKRRIARHVVGLLPDGPLTLAMNGGTTTAEVARALTMRSGLVVVTNSLTTALVLASGPGVRVVLNGGVLRARSFELVGTLAESTAAAVRVRCAVLGADGVSALSGVTTHDDAEARANHAMLRQAARVIVVADGSKVGRTTAARMAAAREVDDLVTDASVEPREVSALRRQGVRVHVVDL